MTGFGLDARPDARPKTVREGRRLGALVGVGVSSVAGERDGVADLADLTLVGDLRGDRSRADLPDLFGTRVRASRCRAGRPVPGSSPQVEDVGGVVPSSSSRDRRRDRSTAQGPRH